MLAVLVVLLGAAAVCARLGVWQLDRAQLRGAAQADERQAELTAAPADPLADLLAPQTSFSAELVGHKAWATGTYEADELLVPGRSLDGRTGYLVLTPLRVEAEGEPVLAVVRGWAATRAAAQDAAPPAGPVRVTGYLQVGEAAGAPLGADEVEAISPAELVNRWGGPTYSGYLVLQESAPAQGDELTVLPPPTLAGGGLNLQNLAYALQWWIFGGFAVLLWARLVRDETRAAREELEDPAAAAEEGEALDGASGDGASGDGASGGGVPGDDAPGDGAPPRERALTPARRGPDVDAAP